MSVRAWRVCAALLLLAGSAPLAADPLPAYPVEVHRLALVPPGQAREMPLRIVLPAEGGPWPVVVFSHGANSSGELYSPVLDAWAAAGFAVLAPTHIDSESLALGLGPADAGRMLRTRVEELRWLLTGLDALGGHAGLAGRLDSARRAVAGHSLGVMISAIVAGVPWRDLDSGELRHDVVPELSALVSLHGVGRLPVLDDAGWQALSLPVFAVAGTDDPGLTGDGVARPWHWRLGVFDLPRAGRGHALVLPEGDHYLGGLIGRAMPASVPDTAGLAAVNRLSALFLRAELHGDADAARALAAEPPSQPAGRRLERR